MNKEFVGTLVHLEGTCYIGMHPQNQALHVISDANSTLKNYVWEVGYKLVKTWEMATHPSKNAIQPTTHKHTCQPKI